MNQDNVEIGIQQIVMTPEMLQQLIQGMTLSPNVNVQNLERGNFAKCSARFNGEQGTDVNAFIDSILVYKDCVNISEENALKGLPMLLEHKAGIWWQGVKESISSFDAAIEALRCAFGHEIPPYQIYRELFSN
ncbi:activity-regulated cytoskeleton associated protein 2-like [Sitophilus oryzae]|uniref:Activity-regulated cytoskeleton associated protein 2-like n=1 Tax=Sitophilus oryzae TaxID=7048 RepID=A0A6J2XTG1_SITOR|nr:activity-regulated cytoskeleton associated protein 2-like [Sitophilus oryzae]